MKYIEEEESEEESKIVQVYKDNPGKQFLSEFWVIQELRKAGNYDQAESILQKAIPTPAVGDELRKVLSAKASAARKAKDWKTVVECFERYLKYKQDNDAASIKFVNAVLPDLNSREIKWLEEAKKQLDK